MTIVNVAVTAGDVDLDCLGCYSDIPLCVAQRACLFMCIDPSACTCSLCQCNGGCVDAFATCSGLPPYRDCAAIEAMCGGP